MDALQRPKNKPKSETASSRDGGSKQVPKKRRRKRWWKRLPWTRVVICTETLRNMGRRYTILKEGSVDNQALETGASREKKGAANGKSDMEQGNSWGFFKKSSSHL
jgi:hypothetical protein